MSIKSRAVFGLAAGKFGTVPGFEVIGLEFKVLAEVP
jgi:hypothetical protein